jgi:hypothetical protein
MSYSIKQLIAVNLPLTPAETEKFWPVYDQYVNELVAINGKKYALIKQYLQIGATMPDAQAADSVRQWIEVDRSVSDLRMKYVPIYGKVLTPKKTALYYQLDRRVQLMIDLQLTSALPLLEPYYLAYGSWSGSTNAARGYAIAPGYTPRKQR